MEISEIWDLLKEKWQVLPKAIKWTIVIFLLALVGSFLPEEKKPVPERDWNGECDALYMQIVHAKDMKEINEAIMKARIIMDEVPDSIKVNSGGYESLAIVMDSTRLLGHIQYAMKKEAVGKLFSSWDGSCRPVTQCIKLSINDPKSYEHVATEYSIEDNFIEVVCVFSAKNAFGGRVKAVAYAQVDYLGNVISFNIAE